MIYILLAVLVIVAGCGPVVGGSGADEVRPATSTVAAQRPPAANTYAALFEKRSAAIEAARSADGFTRRAVGDPKACYEPNAEDRDRGLVFYRPSLGAHFKGARPSVDEARRSLALEAAGGETESTLLAAWALEPASRLEWRAGERPAALADVAVEVLPVLTVPIRLGRSKEYELRGTWIADGPAAVDLAEEERAAWLVRIRVPGGTPAGSYTVPLEYRLDGTTWRAGVPVQLNVLPFDLVDPSERNYVFGAFCARSRLSAAQYAQMKAHGVDAGLWFWDSNGMRLLNDGGKLRMDFARIDRTMDRIKAAGMRGPVVLALGNDRTGHFEWHICRKFELPMQPRVKRHGKSVRLAALDDPKIEELIVEALRQVFAHAAERKWPEIVVMPYDEPTERLMDEHRRMVRIFRTHFPEVRLYGCSMNRLKWAEQVADCDIIVSNGSFEAIRKMTRQKKLASWFYGGCTVSRGFQVNRWRYGLQRFAHGAEGSWFWSYDFFTGDPWTEFDGSRGDSAWVICWPPLAKGAPSVNTVSYEGLREGVDDVRYALTLESMIEKADPAVAKPVRAAYEGLLGRMRGARRGRAEVDGFRRALVELMLKLR
jgi:hypothetical protein